MPRHRDRIPSERTRAAFVAAPKQPKRTSVVHRTAGAPMTSRITALPPSAVLQVRSTQQPQQPWHGARTSRPRLRTGPRAPASR